MHRKHCQQVQQRSLNRKQQSSNSQTIETVDYLRVVNPRLIPTHTVATNQLDDPVVARRVQAVVIRHELVTLGERKHLISSKAVAIGHSDVFSTFKNTSTVEMAMNGS